ncbi:hypothetical protein CRG98_006481 [Punica granatum]|uniref:Reverse transcriptase domain-containing protein n=1 Tax=Punica granatum TaxID=22663 RepID=A0A2I0KXG3_PUNGR|nr:hypothetical protein CRG98_006481 [Punica granatum]
MLLTQDARPPNSIPSITRPYHRPLKRMLHLRRIISSNSQCNKFIIPSRRPHFRRRPRTITPLPLLRSNKVGPRLRELLSRCNGLRTHRTNKAPHCGANNSRPYQPRSPTYTGAPPAHSGEIPPPVLTPKAQAPSTSTEGAARIVALEDDISSLKGTVNQMASDHTTKGTELAPTIEEYTALIQRSTPTTQGIFVPNPFATIQSQLSSLLGIPTQDIHEELHQGWDHGIRIAWLSDWTLLRALTPSTTSYQRDACHGFLLLVFGILLFPYTPNLIDGAIAQVVLQAVGGHNYVEALLAETVRSLDYVREDQSRHCEYHQGAPGHNTDNCWKLREKIEAMIDDKQLTFNAVKPPNVQANPLPDHGSSSGPNINMISVCAIREYEIGQEPSAPFIIEYVPVETGVGYAGFDATPAPFVIEVPAREPYQDSRVLWTYEGSVGNLERQFSVMGVTRSGRAYENPEAANKGKAPAPTLGIAPKATPIPQKKVTEEEAETFMKIIKASEYKVVEKMGKSPAHISLLALLLGSEPHREALLKVLTAAQVLDIPNAFSLLLGRPWIHSAGAVPSTLHQKLKFIMEERLITVKGEEDYAIYKETAVPYISIGDDHNLPFHSFDTISVIRDYGKTAPGQGINRPIEIEEYKNRRGLGFRPSCHEIVEARRGKHLHRLAAHYGKINRGTPVLPLSHFFSGPQHIVGGTLDGPSSDSDDALVDLPGIYEYQEVFAWSYANMPGLDPSIVKHFLSLDTENFPPKRQHLRRQQAGLLLRIKEEVVKQINAGFLEVCNYSEWVANIMPVEKKDERVRFSFMDGFSGYNQIRMAEEDKIKMTFITMWGTFCYKVIPFGLKNAEATYQRAMVTLFHDMMHKEIEVYVDDMIAKSKEGEDHLINLRRLFERLKKYKLRLNQTKCTFGAKSGKLLGFVVNERGIEVDPDKVKAIRELPPPSTVRESPVLVPPTPSRPLILYLTVRRQSLGCMLGQEDESTRAKHAIYYLSKKFTEGESNYPEIEKMCCALVWAMQRLRQYTLYHTIRLLSKADPLKYLLGSPSSMRNIAKWRCQLTEYDIEYVPRTSVKGQAIADHLAEFPVEDDTPINSDFPDEGILRVDEEENGTAWKMYFNGAMNFHRFWHQRSANIPGRTLLSDCSKSRFSLHQQRGRIRGMHPWPAGGDLFQENLIEPLEIEIAKGPAHCNAIEATDEQLWYGDIKHFLQTSQYSTFADRRDRKTLRRLAAHYFLSGETLYRRAFNAMLLRCVDENEAQRLMGEIHEEAADPT